MCRRSNVKPVFFADSDELRTWFRAHHDRLREQWIGFYKKDSGLASVDWSQSVDVALCFGWIDGLRKKLDGQSYMIRFTPRRQRSHWSARNVSRMEALLAQGLVEEAGLAAYRSRGPRPPASETAATRLPPKYEDRLRAAPSAWSFYQASSVSYRKIASMWVTSAAKEETRLKRLDSLIRCCASGVSVPPLRWSKSAPR